MDLGLAGRVYVVTGGSRGLGLATARELVAEGASVVLGARDTAAVQRADQRRRAAGRTGARADREQWRGAFDSVFLGAVRMCRAVVDALTAEGGSLALVLSTSVKAPIAGLAASNGLRPGLAMLAKTMADELGPQGVRVNGLLPGRVLTDRLRELGVDPSVEPTDIPLHRYGDPAEFGRVAAFVLSPAASYVTGAMVPVDGGSTRAL